MRVAVVGGTGTLGAAVVAELDRRGHRAVALSRRPRASGSTEHRRVDLATGEGLASALSGTVPAAGRIGRALSSGGLTAPDAHRGTLGFAQWLTQGASRSF